MFVLCAVDFFSTSRFLQILNTNKRLAYCVVCPEKLQIHRNEKQNTQKNFLWCDLFIFFGLSLIKYTNNFTVRISYVWRERKRKKRTKFSEWIEQHVCRHEENSKFNFCNQCSWKGYCQFNVFAKCSFQYY